MAKTKKMYESPQAAPDGLTTPVKGGMSPTMKDVMESANARSEKLHNTKGKEYPDYGVLPQVGGESLDKAGIDNAGYLVKKGLQYGVTAFYNTLPPGMDIEDQENADIRDQGYKEVTSKSYPNDNPWGGS